MVLTFVDISARTHTEERPRVLKETLEQQVAERTAELSQRELEFRALADDVPARFCYLDDDDVYRYVNRRSEVELDRPATDIIGKRMEEILGPRLYPTARPHIQKVLSGEEAHFQIEAETAKGPQVFRVAYMPDLDEDQRVKGFFALVSDISARRHAEDRVRLLSGVLRPNRRKYAVALDTIGLPWTESLSNAPCLSAAYHGQGQRFCYARSTWYAADLSLTQPNFLFHHWCAGDGVSPPWNVIV